MKEETKSSIGLVCVYCFLSCSEIILTKGKTIFTCMRLSSKQPLMNYCCLLLVQNCCLNSGCITSVCLAPSNNCFLSWASLPSSISSVQLSATSVQPQCNFLPSLRLSLISSLHSDTWDMHTLSVCFKGHPWYPNKPDMCRTDLCVILWKESTAWLLSSSSSFFT